MEVRGAFIAAYLLDRGIPTSQETYTNAGSELNVDSRYNLIVNSGKSRFNGFFKLPKPKWIL